MNLRGTYTVHVLLFICLLSALALAGCLSPSPAGSPPVTGTTMAPAQETIRIGAIYNLEGSEAAFDVPSLQGARLAVGEINEKGGVLGKPVELVVVDGKSDTRAVVAGVTELAASGTVPVIIGLSNPDDTLPAAQAAAARNVFFVTSGATSPRLPLQVPGYLYLACMGDNTQAAVGAEYAAESLHAKNVYVLYEADKEYPSLLAGYFRTRFQEMNGTVQEVDTFLSTDTGFSSQVRNLTRLTPRPDLVFVAAETWADAKPVIGEIRNAGFTMPVMGGDGYDAPTLLTGGAAGIDTVYYTTHTRFDPATTDLLKRDFMTRYAREYNSTAVPFAGLGYDTVMIVAEALNNAGTPARFSEGMERVEHYHGVTGNLSYPGDSHIPVKDVTLMEIRNGTPMHIGDFVPESVPAP